MPPEVSPIAQLAWIGRAKSVASKGLGAEDGANWLSAVRAPLAIQQAYTKAAVGAIVTDANNSAVAIGPFSDAMASRSVFFRLLSDNAVTRTPLQVRTGVVTVPPTAALVAEGASIPVSKPVLSNFVLQPTRVASLVVCTNELLRDIGPAGQALLSRELANALAAAVDGLFFAAVMSTGVSTTPSSGSSAVNAYTDLRNAMLAVDSGANAKFYWLVSASVAKRAAGLADSAGSAAFSAMTPQGGELCGLPAIVSDGMVDGALALVDATGVAADATAVSIDVSTQADVEMSDTPTSSSSTPTSVSMTSMFQSNSTALRVSVILGAQLLRDTAIAEVTGIAWGSA